MGIIRPSGREHEARADIDLALEYALAPIVNKSM